MWGLGRNINIRIIIIAVNNATPIAGKKDNISRIIRVLYPSDFINSIFPLFRIFSMRYISEYTAIITVISASSEDINMITISRNIIPTFFALERLLDENSCATRFLRVVTILNDTIKIKNAIIINRK
jgi:hypothetical protein